jgi:hypothetical protein
MNNDRTFIKVLGTNSLTDIAIIKSVLDAEGIMYFFQGENLLTLRPADPALLMVAENDLEKTIELLRPLKLNYVHSLFNQKSTD